MCLIKNIPNLKWEFPAEKFDAIVSIATLHHLPVESLLPSLKDALKPGGRLVVLDLLDCRKHFLIWYHNH